MPVQVNSKCRNFPSLWHLQESNSLASQGVLAAPQCADIEWVWKGRALLLSCETSPHPSLIENVCSRLDACAGLSSQETSWIHAEQERRCDSLQGAEISKMRNATFGNAGAIVLKMKLQSGFSKALFALFGQFKSLRRIYSRSFWQATECNLAPWLFCKWRNEFVINALEFKVNSLFREQQNSLWVVPLGFVRQFLSLYFQGPQALESRIMIWRLFWLARFCAAITPLYLQTALKNGFSFLDLSVGFISIVSVGRLFWKMLTAYVLTERTRSELGKYITCDQGLWLCGGEYNRLNRGYLEDL